MSLFDLTPAIGLVTTHTITVTRFGSDTYGVDGRPQARAVLTTFTTGANVQPGGEPLDRSKDDGFTTSDLVTVFCATALQSRDRISIPGLGLFEVERVEDWQTAGAYSEVTARKLAAPFEPVPEFVDSNGKAIALTFGAPVVGS